MGWTKEHMKLFPFYASQIAYWFLFYIPNTQETAEAVVFKCFPILSLLFYGIISRPPSSSSAKRNLYAWVMAGLFCSGIGDGILVFERHFIWGMIVFALGHISYLVGLGWRHTRLEVCMPIIAIFAGVMVFILPKITDPVVYGVAPFYGLLLSLNVWRSIDKAKNWVQGLGALGFCFFAISDAVLICDRYYPSFGNMGQIYVMTTYYAAQYLITIGYITEMKVTYDKD